MGNSPSLAVSIGVPVVSGMAIGVSIAPEIKNWYRKLKKPSWNPPNFIFGPVWTALYTAMGIAAHRVWKAQGWGLPLALYAVQLGLNLAWSPIMFKMHDLKGAAIDITALLGVLAATTYEFSKVDTVAAQLMLPYIAWTSFATALTYWIWLNNDEGGKRVKQEAKEVGGGLGGAAAGARSAARQAGEAVEAAASEATAKAANLFLAQGGERQGDAVPPEVAAATSVRASGSKEE